jgi:fermentation-respiration switch protein FrsA (DUF1100 family)
MRSLVLSTVRPVAVALAVLLAVPPAFARTVRCESWNSRYTYCPVQTYGNVTLRHELSRFSCLNGRGWGYDRHGIWVDRGCRAEFAVDEGHRGSYSGYDYDDHDHVSKGTAAAAGVVLGAAIAAAIVASKNKNRQDDRDVVPNWLVGRFEGYNTEQHADVAMQVSPSGTVTGFLPGGQQVHGSYQDGGMAFGGVEFDVEKTGSGFTLTQRDDRSNVVVYHRDR